MKQSGMMLSEEIRYFRVSFREVFEKLRKYFMSRDDVLIAVLFGSVTRRDVVRDVDVAVYTGRDLGLDDISKMAWELEELLGVPVDLVPLDKALPVVRLKAMTEGRPVVIRDRALYTEILKKTIAEVEDMKLVLQRGPLGG